MNIRKNSTTANKKITKRIDPSWSIFYTKSPVSRAYVFILHFLSLKKLRIVFYEMMSEAIMVVIELCDLI